MSKSYLVLISLLVVAVLAVGVFAYYRSASKTEPVPIPVVTPITPSPTPTPVPTFQNQIALTITAPKTGITVSSPTLTVTGKTVPNADVAINDKDVKANTIGNFTTTITLDEGENEIIVVASDDTGNFSEQTLLVTYTPLP